MLQTILQFLILPLASGAFGGWGFYKIFGKKISPEVRWKRIALLILVSEILVIALNHIISPFFAYHKFYLNSPANILEFVFNVFIYLLPYTFIVGAGTIIMIGLNRLFSPGKKTPINYLIFGSIIGGMISGIIAGNYWGLTARGEEWIIGTLAPIYISIFIFAGIFSGAISVSLLNRKE